MRRLALLVGVGLAAGSLPAMAQTNRAGDSESNQRVCRRIPAELGTRIPPRSVCKTRAEWAAESRDAQSNMRGRHNPGSGDAFRNPQNRATTGG